MMTPNDDIDRIESALAQTQCQLCDYKDCRAYATAIVHENEAIDRCLPGGEKTLRTLAEWTHQDPTPYLNKIRENTKAITQAVIREHECIGCTKCLDACPVDAIIGSGKQMHTVITDLCNGCELCIPPCPVDCIDLVPHSKYHNAHEIADQSQQRYKRHQTRQQQKQKVEPFKKHSLDARKTEIQALLDRVKEKKGIHDEHSKT